MKNIKYIIMLILSISLMTSCFDDATDLDLNDDGNNFATFTDATANVSKIANGDEYSLTFKMKVAGPTSMDLTEDVVVTFAATDESTAVEGTNYEITNNSVTLTKENNYLGFANVVMLTDGIVAPLEGPSPVLYLKPTAVTGSGKVVASGKPIKITLNYACFSNLAGDYSVSFLREGVPATPPYSTITMTQTSEGKYRTNWVGHWTTGTLGGTPGFDFYDVCNVLTIPEQNLVDLYSNLVGQDSGASTVDPDTGVITLNYWVDFTDHTVYNHYTIICTPL